MSDSESIAAASEIEGDQFRECDALPRRARMPVTTVGSWVLVVIIASARGIWWDCGNCGSTLEAAQQICPDAHAIALV